MAPTAADEHASIRILNTLALGAENEARLARVSPRLEFVHRALTAAEWDTLADDRLEVIIGGRLPGSPETTPALRWLQTPSGGGEYLAVPPAGLGAWPQGVTVTNGRGAYSFAIAEYVAWAISDHYQRGANRRRMQEARAWPALVDEEPAVGRRMRGQTVLIAGYGSVGRQVARDARARGMRVLAVKRRPEVAAADSFTLDGSGDADGTIPEQFGTLADLPTLARRADVLVVALPGTRETRNAVSADVIGALPPHALVVVTGRGSTIDVDALVAALEGGRIAGAVVDTFPNEPLAAEDPLWATPHLTVTPHIAGGVAGDPIFHDLPVFMDLLVDNLTRYVGGSPLRNQMDVGLGY